MAITTINNRAINRADTAASGQLWTATSATASDFQAAAAAGKVGQVVSQVFQGTYSLSSQNAFAAFPTVNLTITPTATNSKILVMFNAIFGSNQWSGIRLYRNIGGAGVSEVSGAHGTVASNSVAAWNGNFLNHDLAQGRMVGNHYLDSPSTTSECVYSVYGLSAVTDNMYLGRGYSGYDAISAVRSATIFTGMEILA